MHEGQGLRPRHPGVLKTACTGRMCYESVPLGCLGPGLELNRACWACWEVGWR